MTREAWQADGAPPSEEPAQSAMPGYQARPLQALTDSKGIVRGGHGWPTSRLLWR
jgi:hypothetical protein